MPHVIVVGALVRGNRVLLGHRRADRRHFPDCWDLPGGHVEPGERSTDALARELREEVDVDAAVSGAPSLHVEHRPDQDDGMVLDAWTITTWDGEPRNAAEDEHNELRWVAAEELPHLDLAHPAYLDYLLELLTGSRHGSTR